MLIVYHLNKKFMKVVNILLIFDEFGRGQDLFFLYYLHFRQKTDSEIAQNSTSSATEEAGSAELSEENVPEKSTKEYVDEDSSMSSVSNSNDETPSADDKKNCQDSIDLRTKPTTSLDKVAETITEVETRKDENKENIQQEASAPVDLSQGKVNGGSDVIMLSDLSDDDENSNPTNGLVNGFSELSPDKMKERQRLIKRLQEELRNEEAKLVLLKKLRQSQMLGHMQDSGSHQQNKSQRPAQNAPPPLVRNTQNARPAHAGKPLPPQGYNNRAPQQQHRQQSHAPPPLVMGPRGSGHQQGQQGSRTIQSSSSSQNLIQDRYRNQPAAQPQPPPQPEQTPAQRQAAAKLALRKQLEKTLLQIPPPKPPPPEMNFIPNLGSGEFIMMCGLEEVVTFIKEADARKRGESPPDVKYVFNPFVCVQCKTDFTPVWKREKPGSKNVICENCVTSNQKKALKQEHTNRLKSAFVKALQQEQEIEQKIQQQQQQQQSSTPVTTTQPQTQTQQQPPSAHTAHSSSSAPQRGMTRAASEPYLAHQNMIQAHQASLRANPILQGFPRAMFPYGQPPKSVSDLQRQYLLDMIPRSLPQVWPK